MLIVSLFSCLSDRVQIRAHPPRGFDVHGIDVSHHQGWIAYSDEVVLGQWNTVLPDGHVLRVQDPERITDVVIGALAIRNAGVRLDSYLATLELEPDALDDVRSALSDL